MMSVEQADRPCTWFIRRIVVRNVRLPLALLVLAASFAFNAVAEPARPAAAARPHDFLRAEDHSKESRAAIPLVVREYPSRSRGDGSISGRHDRRGQGRPGAGQRQDFDVGCTPSSRNSGEGPVSGETTATSSSSTRTASRSGGPRFDSVPQAFAEGWEMRRKDMQRNANTSWDTAAASASSIRPPPTAPREPSKSGSRPCPRFANIFFSPPRMASRRPATCSNASTCGSKHRDRLHRPPLLPCAGGKGGRLRVDRQ